MMGGIRSFLRDGALRFQRDLLPVLSRSRCLSHPVRELMEVQKGGSVERAFVCRSRRVRARRVRADRTAATHFGIPSVRGELQFPLDYNLHGLRVIGYNRQFISECGLMSHCFFWFRCTARLHSTSCGYWWNSSFASQEES